MTAYTPAELEAAGGGITGTGCHPQTILEHNGTLVAVDVGIAPLIRWLWDRGFETTASCENFGSATDHKSGCYVTFPDKAQADRFAGMVEDVIPVAYVHVPDDLDTGDPWYPPGCYTVYFPPGVLASRVLSVARKAAA